MEPKFLSRDQALRLHANQIELYGGQHGVRDPGLLESALAQPAATFGDQFLCADLYEMAAAYLYHIVCNHPFIDGNKRAGAVAALVFLDANGIEFTATEGDFEQMVMSVAEGRLLKPAIADFFRANSYVQESPN